MQAQLSGAAADAATRAHTCRGDTQYIQYLHSAGEIERPQSLAPVACSLATSPLAKKHATQCAEAVLHHRHSGGLLGSLRGGLLRSLRPAEASNTLRASRTEQSTLGPCSPFMACRRAPVRRHAGAEQYEACRIDKGS